MKQAIIGFFLFFSANLLAQSDELNLQKYWHYRYRLTNYYLVVGEGQGMSLPADSRNYYFGNLMRWGEGTVYLGYYTGVLATEYRLLKDNGQSTDQTCTELYYSLLAAIRLDNYAEWSFNQPNATDGFLVRDDVPAGFVQAHINELNVSIPMGQPAIFGAGKPGEIQTESSDHIVNLANNQTHKNAVSKDMLLPLLMGFAMVAKFVDSGNVSFYNYTTGNTESVNLKQLAIDETDLIISYIKENHGQHWEIRTPDNNTLASDGGNCLSLSYPLAILGQQITGIDYSDVHTFFNEPLWQASQDADFIRCEEVGQDGSARAMVMLMAALTDSWKNIGGSNTTPDQILAIGDYDAGGTSVCTYEASHYGWDVFYGMIWDLFHGANTYIGDLCQAKTILDGAFWDGPYFHTTTDLGYPGWCASRRFFDDAPVPDVGKDGFQGNYNGLDYMLLFNLYYLDARAQSRPFYIPQTNPFVSDHYPYWDAYLDPPFGGYQPIGNIYSPDAPVIVNQLSVTAGSMNNPGVGNLTIYGGVQGVLLQNTSVDQYGTLTIFNTSVNPHCVPLQPYFFDASGYHYRLSGQPEPEEGGLPPYIPNEEFSSIATRNQLNVFPSPAINTIQISGFEGTGNLEIFDLNGKSVLSIPNYTSGNYVNVESLSSGCYVAAFSSATLTRRVKFIKQ